MKIYFSPTSPYVRKCMVTAHELGLADLIELLPASAHPVTRDASIVANNPLGKVPTFITDDGQVLYDSRVICEYLNALGHGRLLPAEGPARWEALTLQSLGDGILDAALLARYENNVRPQALRWPDWVAGKIDAIHTSLAHLNQHPELFAKDFHLGLLTIGCALWYLDLRYPELAWRDNYPALAQASAATLARSSMAQSWSL
ncbi:glutathione S-transferase [Limnohabitans sp. JirII-31]|uniref:glutathione S-transferase n=1 Tax=Limnohabitans sp. JirII-31 TaxID=1977908 RepID=UPI000C1F80C4|nr:glutathione S-transferase [Limnohabitans sp. JirII-31]PIT79404.1 glutathione S-transferase [Limnohabitans sp. JirII-31]